MNNDSSTTTTNAAEEAKRREKEQARIDEYKSLLDRLVQMVRDWPRALRAPSVVEWRQPSSTETDKYMSSTRDPKKNCILCWHSVQRDDKAHTKEALALSGQVLALNPEFQTGWGIRRRVLLDGVFDTMSVLEPVAASAL